MEKFLKTSALVCALFAAATVPAASAEPAASVEVLNRPAMQTVRAGKMAMLDVVRAGERLVAGGEAGVVLLSDDGGKSWRQAKVPVSVSITALQFVDAKVGYATAHMGVVLKTTDGGETWTKLLDGIAAAQLVLQHAEARQAAGDPGAERALRDAQLLVDDGPDKPFLNLYFQTADTGYVLGAYNLIFRTTDGGKTWQPWQDRVANPRGFHLYGMARSGDALFIAGEQGLLLRATDGETFTPLATPYKGSWFGIVAATDGALVAYGLRGNAWRSTDQGETWSRIDTGVPVAISAGRLLADGRLALVAQSGAVLLSADGGARFEALSGLPPLPLSGLAQAPDGQLVAASLAGALRLAPPQP